MKGRKLIHDSFYVNNESFSGVTINHLSDLVDGLEYSYTKLNDNWKLSILSGNTVIHVPGIITPIFNDILIPPTGLTTSGLTDSIDLTWINDRNDTQTYIERTEDDVNFSLIDIVNTGITYYSDYDVTDDIDYYYKVKSYKGNKFSEYSNTQQGSNLNPPAYTLASLYLDGTIVDVEGSKYFVDKKAGNNILITGYDFPTGWTKGFPYKSSATIDIFGKTGVSVASLFQNIDYINTSFCKHSPQIVDANEVETYAPRVSEIVIYSEPLTDDNLTKANIYFGVPVKPTSAIREVGTGKTYATIAAAITAATAGDSIYIYSGTYIENISILKQVNIQGVGVSRISPTAAQSYGFQSNQSMTIKNIHFVANGNTWGVYVNNAGSVLVELCRIEKSIDRSVWMRASSLALIKNCNIDGYIYYQTANIQLEGNHIKITSAPNQSALIKAAGGFANSYTFTTKYNRIILSEALTANFNIAEIAASDDLFLNNYVYAVSLSNIGFKNIKYNTIYAERGFASNSAILCAVTFKNISNNYFKILSGTGWAVNTLTSLTGTSIFEDNVIDIFDGQVGSFQQANSVSNSLSLKRNIFISRNIAFSGSPATFIGLTNGTTPEVSSVVVENNTFLNPRYFGAPDDKGGHCCLFVQNQTKATIKYNYLEGSSIGDIVFKGTTTAANGLDASLCLVSYNVIPNGRFILKGVSKLKFYNNYCSVTRTFGDSTNPFEVLLQSPDVNDINNDIRNNIFINNNNSLVFKGNISCNNNILHNNLFYSPVGFSIMYNGVTYNTFADFVALGLDVNSMNYDPNIISLLPTPPINGESINELYDDGLDMLTAWGNETTLPKIVNKQQGVVWQIGAYVQ